MVGVIFYCLHPANVLSLSLSCSGDRAKGAAGTFPPLDVLTPLPR